MQQKLCERSEFIIDGLDRMNCQRLVLAEPGKVSVFMRFYVSPCISFLNGHVFLHPALFIHWGSYLSLPLTLAVQSDDQTKNDIL